MSDRITVGSVTNTRICFTIAVSPSLNGCFKHLQVFLFSSLIRHFSFCLFHVFFITRCPFYSFIHSTQGEENMSKKEFGEKKAKKKRKFKRHLLFNYIYFNCTYKCCAIYTYIYNIYRYAYLEMNFKMIENL